jgi:hypothetical protein
MDRHATTLQHVLAGAAMALDATIALAFALAAWPMGAVVGVFPLMTVGVVASRRRARFRALAGLVAAVHIVVGVALFLIGGLALATSGLLLLAALIAPSPERRPGRWDASRRHALMVLVASFVLLAIAPWAAGLWPG